MVYDALSKEEKDSVENYSTLKEAEAQLKKIKPIKLTTENIQDYLKIECFLQRLLLFLYMRATIPFAAAKPLRRHGRRSGRGRAARSIPTVDAAFPSVLPGGNAESEAACRKVSGLCASVG